MILTSDYHTHTVYSHGKGQIIDNAIAAKEKGLKEVGISDHGFAHPAFGLTKRKVPKMRELCDLATKETGVKVLLGVESNIIGTDGRVDLKSNLYDYFDIFLAGIHKFVMYKIGSVFPLALPDLFYATLKKKDVPKSLIKTNTKTFILLPNIVKIPESLDTDYVAQITYETAIRNTCGILILIPLVIIYLFAQRTLIEGVERSGITG